MIRLNFRDARPIYEQIEEDFKKLILSGGMEDNEKLPSVRTLATQLSINPNTIQRAYNELETKGYIYSVPGKGSFVCERSEKRMERVNEIKKELLLLIQELKDLEVDLDEIKNLFDDKAETRGETC